MKTKLLWITLVSTTYFNLSFGQGVSIGDKEFTPNNAAILDVQSQNKGVLVPRMTYVQRMYIQTNAQSTGLLVYQTDRDAGFYYWDGVKWEYLAPPQTVELPNLSTVATTGSYSDLLNKPVIPTTLSELTQSDQYHTVSNTEKEYWNSAAAGANFSGDYNDLTNKPTIPTRLQDLEQDPNYYTTVSRAERERWDAAASNNAFSGDYNDLTNKPTIPTRLQDLEQDPNYYTTVSRAERERWDAAASNNAFSGDYNDLTNKPTIPTRLQDLEQDPNYYTTVSRTEREKWNAAAEANAFSGNYNDLTNRPDLQTVATTGSYNDLQDKPAIPTRLQDLQQDELYYTTVTKAERDKWNATAQVNSFSGDYNDLTNKPYIPTTLSELSQNEYYRTVSDAEKTAWNNKSNFSGYYYDLPDKPTIPTMLRDLQDDYNHLTVTELEKMAWNGKSSFSGRYTDLEDRPAIPTHLNQLQQDGYSRTVSDEEKAVWNGKSNFSGSYMDLSDRPNISTAATSGNYNDLFNKPFIPTKLNELDDDANHHTVSDAEKAAWNGKSNFSGNYNDLSNLPELLTPEIVNTLVNSAILAAFPSGCVIMWTGDPNDVPTGWEIFYQMSGRFPVGAQVDAHYANTDYSYGKTGGEEKHQLTIDEMPKHSHTFDIYSAHSSSGNGWVLDVQNVSWAESSVSYVGDDEPHENRPPYFAIYFIKKK